MDNPPFCQVDLQRSAGQLAVRLSSMQSFVDAVRELLTITNLSASDRQKYAKKIITLIEIAHATLTRAGVKLHTFTSCPTNVAPHKEAYFNLLRRLEAFRSDVEQPNLRERVVRLLFPLYSLFVIHRGESSSRGGLQPPCTRVTRMEIPPGLRRGRLTLSSQRQGNPSALMPPPDAFPDDHHQHEDRLRGRSRHKSINSVRSRKNSISWSPIQPSDSPDEQDDDDTLAIVYRPPLARRFGIFCTGKKSFMDHCWRAGDHQTGDKTLDV